MKYIDADIFRAKITDLCDNANFHQQKAMEESDRESFVSSGGEIFTYKKVLSLIDSLQQEQDSVAERFARVVRGNLIGIDEEVQQKFEQLYFEVTGNKMYGGYND